MSKRGWILFLALGVIWGMPYLLIRVAVESIDPLVVAFGRTLIGALGVGHLSYGEELGF